MNFRNYESIQIFGTPWTKDRPVSRLLSIQDNTIQKNSDIHHACGGIRSLDSSVRTVHDIRVSVHEVNGVGK